MKIIDMNDSERECTSAALDPNYPGFVRVEFRRHHEWFSIAEFKQKNPNFLDLNNTLPPEEAVGVVSSATEKTLNDKTKKWNKDVYKGYKIWISRGKGEGQVRFVSANDKTHVEIDQAWEVKPNSTSQYVISMNIHDVGKFHNTLPSEDIKILEKRAKLLDKQHTAHTLKKKVRRA